MNMNMDSGTIIKTLAANYVLLSILDISSTVYALRKGIGHEGNGAVQMLINQLSLNYTMLLKLVVVGIILVLVWKSSKVTEKVKLSRGRAVGGREVLIAGLVFMNVFYLIVIFNNVRVMVLAMGA